MCMALAFEDLVGEKTLDFLRREGDIAKWREAFENGVKYATTAFEEDPTGEKGVTAFDILLRTYDEEDEASLREEQDLTRAERVIDEDPTEAEADQALAGALA